MLSFLTQIMKSIQCMIDSILRQYTTFQIRRENTRNICIIVFLPFRAAIVFLQAFHIFPDAFYHHRIICRLIHYKIHPIKYLLVFFYAFNQIHLSISF